MTTDNTTNQETQRETQNEEFYWRLYANEAKEMKEWLLQFVHDVTVGDRKDDAAAVEQLPRVVYQLWEHYS